MVDSAADVERLFEEFRRSGDPRALGEVYDRLAPELLRVALHSARDAAEAEDALQAAFLVAIQEARRWDPARRLLPWLVGILANESAKARARGQRRPDSERVRAPADESPEEAAQRAELLAQLDLAFERVPVEYRPVLQLRLRHGLSLPEIAAVLERPPGTVRSQLARGTEALRRLLPAGLVGGVFALVAPTRGLAAIRAEVLSQAALVPAGAAVAAVAAVSAGALAVKKLAVVAAVLVAGWFLWQQTSEPSTETAPVAEVAALPEAAEHSGTTEPGGRAGATAAPVQAETRRRVESAPGTAAAPAAEPKPQVCSLTVHARWDDGAPAEGEIVILNTSPMRVDEGRVTTTDASGTALFSDLPTGGARVRLLRGREADLVLRAGRDHERTLEIPRGVELEGRVVDARGAAVAGAGIWLSERWRNNIGHRIAETDQRGEFRVRSVPLDHYVGAFARGFAASHLHPVRGAPGDRARFVIALDSAGAPLEVEVVAAAGAPLAGARVLAGIEQPAGVRTADGTFVPGAPPQRALTGADGVATIESVAMGAVELQVRAQGFAPASLLAQVLPGGRNRVRVELGPGAALAGRAVDSAGAPVGSATVFIGEPEGFASSRTLTGNDGSFELAGLPAGRHAARIEHALRGTAARTLVLVAGDVVRWDATLDSEPNIAGVILGADGAPRGGMTVIAIPGAQRERAVRSDRSDGKGRFRVTGLQQEPHEVWVQSPEGWREFPLLQVLDVWPGGAPLTLRLEDSRALATVAARIESADGRPLGGAELQIWHAERRTWRAFVSGGERGEVRAENVPPGTVTLELRHPEHPWKRLGEHVLGAGETLDLGTVALDAAGSLLVHLRGIPDEDCAALNAVLIDAASRECGVAVITAGSIAANALAPGKHTLRVGGDGWLQVQREFEIAAGVRTELDVDLVRASVREVHFRWPSDAAAPKWIALSLLDAQGALVFGGNADCLEDPPGATVTALPGSYRLWANAEGGLSGNAEVRILAAGQAAAPFVMELARQP